jgi:hypothetical protein
MNPTAFLASAGGRIAVAATGYLLLGAGIVALADPGTGLPLAAFVLIIPAIVAFIAAVLLAVDTFAAEVMAMLLGLPIAAGLYLAALQVMPGSGPVAGVPLLAAGAGLGWMAARRRGSPARPATP